jgi:hypothetical protein
MLPDIKESIIKNKSVVAIVAAMSKCTTCEEWIPNILEPLCKENNIEIYRVDLDKEFVLLPPAHTPTTYFYVSGHRDPMIVIGPEPIENMIERIKVCFNELSNI